MKEIAILGIESSCDETAAAVIQNGRTILANVVSTQIDIHKKFGGVVPEVASRNHVVDINRVLEETLEQWGRPLQEIDAIAVTYGPGLAGALLVGLSTAKALSFALNKPLVGVNHIEGHIAANYIAFPELKPPFISLIVSGGHTHIVEVQAYNRFCILGKTTDDAAGEAYDKVARAIGLGYPGGPQVDALAKQGSYTIDFPKSYYKDDSYNFSFSGLKSAVLNYINSCKMKGLDIHCEDIACSFQETVVDVLLNKALKAVEEKGYHVLVLSGGVSANSRLRERMKEECDKRGYQSYYPPLSLCTDNAAMIASAGYYRYMDGIISDLSLSAKPNLKIGER
ncbi:tRNA (adenosine(37)-N6)-threonylcarbamoyltransferase complex transferase subunit TsaD [Filifactor alocis]|uniref:tRNA (adenosine(37)-N6)-threonylcarbamoyltransferase complex transferase subunit TsaD n=1 Tax=Filifactor alocis TaxID=143361 RepID=UPI003FA1069E